MLRNRALNGWKFRRQHPIDRFVVDFACLKARLIVEVDGATHSTASEVAQDAARTAILESLGFALLRIPNADIHEHRDGVRETILAALERRDTVESRSRSGWDAGDRRARAERGAGPLSRAGEG